MAGTPLVVTTSRSVIPFPGVATPSGLRSPATLGSPRTYSPPKVKSPVRVPSPRVPSPLRVPSPQPVASPKQVASPVRVQSPVGTTIRLAVSPPPLTISSLPPRVGSPRPSVSPQQVMSPRRMSSSSMQTSSRTTSPIIGTGARALAHSTSSPRLTRLGSLTAPESPQIQRTISAESAATPSPATTHESLITPGDTPVQARRGSRVWDPARGVDVFKRGSEEVLARFLRMGSFEGEEGKEGKRSTAT